MFVLMMPTVYIVAYAAAPNQAAYAVNRAWLLPAQHNTITGGMRNAALAAINVNVLFSIAQPKSGFASAAPKKRINARVDIRSTIPMPRRTSAYRGIFTVIGQRPNAFR